MTLKDRTTLLKTADDVDAFLGQYPNCAVFKAGTCHKTEETLGAVDRQLGPREDLPLGFIRVVEARPASNHLARLSGFRHESPQIVLFRDGKAVFECNNWDITDEALQEGLAEHFATV
jgi:bacillithiol system protein YtxJ